MAKVGILNIGDELLIGQVINTNAADMAKILNNNGFDVCKSIRSLILYPFIISLICLWSSLSFFALTSFMSEKMKRNIFHSS